MKERSQVLEKQEKQSNTQNVKTTLAKFFSLQGFCKDLYVYLNMYKTQIGKYYEHIAASYLSRNQYKVLATNFFTKCGELDIVTQFLQDIIFIEVKSISADSEFSIYHSLTKRKLERVNKAAQYWLRLNKLENSIYRIEFIGIISYSDKYYLEHFKYIQI